MEVKSPVVSLFSAALRVKKWKRIYRSLRSNKVPFEIIYVGDRRPKFELPDNFRFIYSRVKPAQCCHIAVQHARGDFIILAQDDLVFGDQALDRLLSLFEKKGDNKTIVSCDYYTFRKWKSRKKKIPRDFFSVRDSTTPILPIAGLTPKILWDEINGIDRRFICSYWDLDVAMRVWEVGGKVIVQEDAEVIEVKEKKNCSIMPSDPATHDRNLFYSLWLVHHKKPKKRFTPERPVQVHSFRDNPYKVVLTRSVPCEPYENRDDILEVSQGNRGQWR